MLALEDSPRAHRIFADIIQSLVWDHGEDDPALRRLLTRAIAEAWGRPSVLANVAGKLIKSRLAAGGRLEDDALLRVLLPAAPNSDVALERILTKARHDILVRALAGESGDADFAAALAWQCYLNEYVFDLAADEAATVAALATRQAGGEQLSEPLLVALACYLPLGRLAHAERLTAKSAALAALLRQQRDEPAEEKRLAAAMPRLTPIEDQVSRQVQAQYEENPYPRWVRLQEPPPRTQVGAYLRSRFPYARLAQSSLLEKPDMLVAGCGTGQSTLELARQFTLGEVLAIDLSSASLAHGARKAAEAGMNDVRFAQADILRIGALGRQFGLIESGGVLHHMADPFAGWRALVDCMAPGGVMLAAFYSQAARRAIAKTRSWIAGEGFTATPEGIRACRRRLMQEEAEGKLFLKAGDFFSMSACRDLLFHVQEHNMTLAQIAGFIAANGLSFIGFEVTERVMANYRERFPDDPGAVNFANWSQTEAESPGTFAAMYQFWVQKR
jgi:SAM-dependent methyltransferase